MERTHIISINGENKEVPWYIEKRHCDFCNKDFEHNGYERDVKIRVHHKEDNYRQCCSSCFKTQQNNLRDSIGVVFVNYLPTFCDGGTYKYEVFKTIEELIQFLDNKYINSTKAQNILCCEKNCIIVVCEENWYVVGYVNRNMCNYLPYWKDKVKHYVE